MIIVEGMDNSGKTTLLNSMHEQFGMPIEHSPSHLVQEERYDEWFQWIEASLKPELQTYAYDRHPIISEYVYGPVLRQQNLLTGTSYLDRLRDARPLLIYCRPDDDTIFDFRKPEMTGVKENADQLLWAYDQMMSRLYRHGFTVLAYNFKDKRGKFQKESILYHTKNHLSNLTQEVIKW